jgi:alcohol dehydrogenase, propanol-preferring
LVLDINEVATLSCSALTAYNAVKNASLRPDDNLVVVGAGGLGLMAMQLAKAVTGSKIIAMDLEDEKLKQARNDGHADNIVNSKKDDPKEWVWKRAVKIRYA